MSMCLWPKTKWLLYQNGCYIYHRIDFSSQGDLTVQPLGLFGIFRESIDTRVKYPDNFMATVYLCIRPVIFMIIQEFFTQSLETSMIFISSSRLCMPNDTQALKT